MGFLCVAAGDVLCESEIQQLYNAFRGHQDVRWFEIAMNDPLGVSGFERGSDLPGEAQNRGRRKRLPLFRGDNRRSANTLHDQIVRTDIVNLADIMIQRCDCFGFALEPLAKTRAGNFDSDLPIQTCVLGQVHFSHPAHANGRQDFVRAESIAGRQRHIENRAESSLFTADREWNYGSPDT